MQRFFGIILAAAFTNTMGCATTERTGSAAVSTVPAAPSRTVEAGCAMCIYHMKGIHDCVLAVNIDGRPCLVKGSALDDHGDAHAPDGLCNKARRGTAVGRFEGDRFVVTRLSLAP